MRWPCRVAFAVLRRVVLAPALFGILLLTAIVVAQPPPVAGLPLPRISLVAPNGAKAGGTVEIAITGGDIEDPTGLFFSHPGITAELIETPDPKVDPKQPPPAVKKKGMAGPVMIYKYKVTVAADVPLGQHDLRVMNQYGVSNPRAFVVGDLNEVNEKEPNNDVEQAQKVELNTTINGIINAPTDVDYYSFKGTKGQRVVCSCLASGIESRAHPVLELFEATTGKKLAGNRDYHHNDALVDATLPADGDYLVRLAQFTHTAGGPEYFYRLSISTAPWIDAVLPPMVEAGKSAQLTVYGRNLPGGQPDPTMVLDGAVLEKAVVTVNAPNDPMALQRLAFTGHVGAPASNLDGFEYRLKNAAGSSNPYLIQIARAPVVADNNANSKRETPQALTLPCEVAGRLDRAHPVAWYSFAAKKGEAYSIELIGDRMGSPIDLAFNLYNADTKGLITEQDDDLETLSPSQLYTRTTDPARYAFKVPADGNFQLLVKSNESPTRAGPRQLYRLRVAPEAPDFRLVAMAPSPMFPEAMVLRPASHQEVTVFVWRRDGFTGPIEVSMDGLPAGVTCKPQIIGPGVKQASLVIGATPEAATWTGEAKIKGTAKINGQDVVREARSATITFPGNPGQVGLPLFSRLDRSLVLAMRDKSAYSVTIGSETAAAPQGDKITLPVKVDRHLADFKTPVSVVALNLPVGVLFNNNNAAMPVANDVGSLVLTVGPQTIPGTYTIAFRGAAQVPFAKDPMAKTKPNVNLAAASNPVTITILPKSVANVTLTPPNANAKVGTPVDVAVKVARLFDYAGEFKVELVQPANAKGIAAPEVVIPAGKDEAKLTLTIDADAAVGNRADLIVRATAMFGTTPVVHEAKLAINITK